MIKQIAGKNKCNWFYFKCPYIEKNTKDIYRGNMVILPGMETSCRMLNIVIGDGFANNRHPKCKKAHPDGLWIIDQPEWYCEDDATPL